MPIKKDSLSPPKNLVPATFDKLLLLFSKKVNLVFSAMMLRFFALNLIMILKKVKKVIIDLDSFKALVPVCIPVDCIPPDYVFLSVPSAVSKIFEKLVNNRLDDISRIVELFYLHYDFRSFYLTADFLTVVRGLTG